ncbi:MAG: site-specific DNA-methyltransferase, partial [Spirochaetia bacterium]
ATRKVAGNFRLYTNHSRATVAFEAMGFQSLPLVLWRKQTNAPNKFMGSGMLPSGAYVTLEHEYILVLRKGDKREFKGTEAETRRASAFFWEERNIWFSDTWEFKGIRQTLGKSDARARSAAYPFELAYRLINMYSVLGDTVLDPFLGTGTTSAASLVAARNSIGYEIMGDLKDVISETMDRTAYVANQMILERFQRHQQFIDQRREARGTPLGHSSGVYGFLVMTRQEEQMRVYRLDRLSQEGPGHYIADHSTAQPDSSAAPIVETDGVSSESEDQLGFSFTN